MKKLVSLAIEQKENTTHGVHMFPLQKYKTILSDKYPVVTAHWHEEAELALITEGRCSYQINLEEYDLAKGDFILIPPLVLHSIYPALLNIFEQIHALYTEEPLGYELMLKSLFLNLIYTLLPYGQEQNSIVVSHTINSDKLKNVLDHIEAHYAEELSIAKLAGLCYFSEYHFMRFFKKHVGMTCLEYINNLRLEKAVELLEQGEEAVLEVSLSVGFHNLSYFYRAFKKKYGVTPKTYLIDCRKK